MSFNFIKYTTPFAPIDYIGFRTIGIPNSTPTRAHAKNVNSNEIIILLVKLK